MIFGGEKKRGQSAKTESIDNSIGMKEAPIISNKKLKEEKKYITFLVNYFIEQLEA